MNYAQRTFCSIPTHPKAKRAAQQGRSCFPVLPVVVTHLVQGWPTLVVRRSSAILSEGLSVQGHTLIGTLQRVRRALSKTGGNMRQALSQEALEALISTQGVREVRCIRKRNGWGLEARLGGYWLPVRSKREPIRIWASLTAVGRFCEALGIKTLSVEL